jgi:hypothetical protein
MSRFARVATAIVLVVTLGATWLADWCALSCEAAGSAATTAEPTCHHADSSVVRIGHAPTPCSHDHHGVVVLAATNPSGTSQTSTSAPALAVHATTVHVVAITSHASTEFGPPISSIPLALSATLRV